MANIPHIAIDPHLLFLPNPCDSAEEIISFAQNLLGWKSALDRRDMVVLFSSACVQALFDDNHYPLRHELKSLCRKYSVDSVDSETVARVAQSVLERIPSLEEHTSISYVLCGEGDISIEPRTYLDRLAANSRSAYEQALVTLAYHYTETATDRCVIASTPPSEETPPQISVEAAFEAIEYWAPPHESKRTIEGTYTTHHEIDVFTDYARLLQALDSLDVWGDSTSCEAASDAIDSFAARLQAMGVAPEGDPKTYILGAMFLHSITDHHIEGRGDVLGLVIETCARIVLGQPKNEVLPFRVNESPTSGQRMRPSDNARAWRTHITKSHEAWRLMFWELEDGRIEFANVGPKAELEIY